MGTFTNNGTTFANDSTLGVVALANPLNAQSTDSTYTTAVLLATQATNYLKATGFNFSIPLDATVSGVTVSVIRHSSVGSTTNDNSIRLVKAGAISGNDKATGTAWPTVDGTVAYGSSSDLWGLSLTPGDVNDPNFGVVISAITTLAATASIDSVQIAISYLGSNNVATGKPLEYDSTQGNLSVGVPSN